MELNINNDFKDLIPPLTQEEYAGLEQSIIDEGCRDSLIIWNDTIVDGHNRYEICKKHNVDFLVADKTFSDNNEVKKWIIENQIGRRNLNKSQLAVIALEYEKILSIEAEKRQKSGIKLSTVYDIENLPDLEEKLSQGDSIDEAENIYIKNIIDYPENKVFVYFIQSEDGGNIKIGCSNNVAERLKQLQTSNPEKLRITNVLPGGYDKEKELHEQFNNIRVEGEWFKPTQKLCDLSNAIPMRALTSAEQAGKMLGVSGNYVKKVKYIEENSPDDISNIINGNLSVNKVYKEVKNRIYQEKEAELKDTSDIVIDNITDRYKLYNCDILEAPIEDNSLDVIITDPPYPKEFLNCWDKLAEFASNKLKDGGVLIAMSGQSYLPEVYRRMTIEGLNYYWTCCIRNTMSPDFRQKRLKTHWKPLLFYVKGNYTKTFLKSDTYEPMDYRETVEGQKFHKWGQSYNLMKRIIEDFSYASETICDPFAGGGTTIVAGLELKRKMIGIELEKEAYNTILRRL